MNLYTFTPNPNSNSSAIPLYHLKKPVGNGKMRITGYCKGIEPTSILQFESSSTGFRYDFLQVNKISYRNHKGVFKNPENAINSFFDAECSFIPNDGILKQITHVNGVKVDAADLAKVLK